MLTRKPNPCARNHIPSPWWGRAVLILLPLVLASLRPQIPPTCQEVRDVPVASPCHSAASGANGTQLTPRVRDQREADRAPSRSVVTPVPRHALDRLTRPRSHVGAQDDCGHCYDMDDKHFAYSIGKRKDYGPGQCRERPDSLVGQCRRASGSGMVGRWRTPADHRRGTPMVCDHCDASPGSVGASRTDNERLRRWPRRPRVDADQPAGRWLGGCTACGRRLLRKGHRQVLRLPPRRVRSSFPAPPR